MELHRLDPFQEAVKALQACTPIETPSGHSLLSCGPTGTLTGDLAGYVARWDKPDGGKAINLPDLRERSDDPVLMVKGEKTSDALGTCSRPTAPSHRWAKALLLSDWRPLKGREVVVSPDNDPDGRRYAREDAALVHKAGASAQIHHLTVERASVTVVVGWMGSQLAVSVLIRWSRKPETGPKTVWQTFSAVVGHSAASALG